MKWMIFPPFQQSLILIDGTSKVENLAGLVLTLSTVNPLILNLHCGKISVVENYVESVGKARWNGGGQSKRGNQTP